MMLHIALVAEILATVICIHCIYGRKVKLDVKTVGLILGILIILEIINAYQLGGVFSFIVYIIIFVYCKNVFKSSYAETTISLILYIIVLTTLQFICILFMNVVISDNQLLRNAISNILVLIICAGCLSKSRLHRIQESMCRKSRYVILLLGFMFIVVIIMLLQEKFFYKIQAQHYLLVIPAIILLLYSILKWYTVQMQAEKMEEEIGRVEQNAKAYENLLTKVRLRQHEFKNHIATIFSLHYTHKSYEKLVQAQEEYCNKLMEENRYNNLLLLGNNILAAFLYGKFQEADGDGIEINYKVTAKVDKMQVPVYYVIEMIGILFDNAVEALKNSAEKVISVEINETKENYEFVIKNPFHYVSYDEIEEWFHLERSEKGSGRGLGLYHLKCLCDEWKCDISCNNLEIEHVYWIAFTLYIRKADNT